MESSWTFQPFRSCFPICYVYWLIYYLSRIPLCFIFNNVFHHGLQEILQHCSIAIGIHCHGYSLLWERLQQYVAANSPIFQILFSKHKYSKWYVMLTSSKINFLLYVPPLLFYFTSKLLNRFSPTLYIERLRLYWPSRQLERFSTLIRVF